MKLGKLFRAAVETVTLPIAIAVDVVSLGQAQATKKKVDKIEENLDEVLEELK